VQAPAPYEQVRAEGLVFLYLAWKAAEVGVLYLSIGSEGSVLLAEVEVRLSSVQLLLKSKMSCSCSVEREEQVEMVRQEAAEVLPGLVISEEQVQIL
jgi:hypothetical protein